MTYEQTTATIDRASGPRGTCQMAGEGCQSTETTVLRLAGIGDRRICADHIAVLERLGMHFRRLSDREPKPSWRQRSLLRDETGYSR